jgi:hypothetical protein
MGGRQDLDYLLSFFKILFPIGTQKSKKSSPFVAATTICSFDRVAIDIAAIVSC